MKINSQIISIPPYISVSWDKVSLLQTKNSSDGADLLLVLQLTDGKEVSIPNLGPAVINEAFEAHIQYVENQKESLPQQKSGEPEAQKSPAGFMQQLMGLTPDQLSGMPIRFGVSGMPGMEGMDMAMQHNQAQSDTPDLPPEVIEKISGVAKLLTGGDLSSFPKPEAHCNCTHCQVARAIHGISKVDPEVEEPITEEDLKFRDWDVAKVGDKLYTATNPLDTKESYNVYIGTPVGCTCGQEHCEHIRAVLSS